MTAIIDYDVRFAGFSNDLAQKLLIALVSPERMDPPLIVRAFIGNIDAVNSAFREIPSPHAQRASPGVGVGKTANANLQQNNVFPPQGSKVPFIVLAIPMLTPFVRAINLRQPAQVAPIKRRERLGKSIPQAGPQLQRELCA